MIPMMVKILQDTGTSETAEELHAITETFVMELNGKQTIYQMMRLAEEVVQRGGQGTCRARPAIAFHEVVPEEREDERGVVGTQQAPGGMAIPQAAECVEVHGSRVGNGANR